MNSNYSKNHSPSNDILKAASNNAPKSNSSTFGAARSSESQGDALKASPGADENASDKRDGKQTNKSDVAANESPNRGNDKAEAPAATPTSR